MAIRIDARELPEVLRLTPPELGTLRIQMSIAEGVVSAQFTATSEQTQLLLERGLPMLRASLEQQGLTVDKLAVQVTPPESTSSMRHDSGAEGDPTERETDRQDAGQGESRSRGTFPAVRMTFRLPMAASTD